MKRFLHYLKITLQAIFLGALIGLTIGVYQLIAEELTKYSDIFFTYNRNTTIILFCILLLLIGVFAFIILSRNKDMNGSGVPQYELMIHHGYKIKWYKDFPLMFISSLYSYTIGAGLGSEGPSVFLGGMIGEGTNKLFKCTDHNTSAVGGGIGFGCAFSSPIAGIIYTFEEALNHHFNIKLVYKTILGGFTAFFIKSLIFNHNVIYFKAVSILDISKYWILIFVAVIAFIVGILFLHGVLLVKDIFKHFNNSFIIKYRFFIIVPLILLVSVFFNEFNGGGTKIINNLCNYKSIWLLLGLLLFRIIYSAFSTSSSLSGGLLVPMLTVGAISSAIVFYIFEGIGFVTDADFNIFLICGMLGVFANVTKSPLTASALALSFTNYTLAFIPAVIVIIISCLLGKLFKTLEIYEALIKRL